MVELTRECNIIYAKMAEQAERYEDMVFFMENVVKMGEILTPDERNLLSVAFKNVVGARRSAWRVLDGKDDKLGEKDSEKEVVKAFKDKITEELGERCRQVVELLDTFLLTPILKDDEDLQAIERMVFYLKMKADYCRYLVESADKLSKEKYTEESLQAYENAMSFAEKLPSTNPIRLGLALNFSVFYFEIKNDKDKACELAKACFDEAISELDELKEESYKDSTLIMQLLRDNITLWTAEPMEADPE
ncbi:14-3-3-like protein [Xenia sp. Carnegie-2017]|uniref:14-3-3-like protein n=1 Tax=Xenia sp. Carnegie-2017 TaxID=2897299 RepID=UPI001F0372E0|nr:14-3-3-like protein [Xenia sp. Carnegie-2017]